MKRKLIQFNEFEELKNQSLSATVKELVEAEEIIAQKLGENSVSLVSFNDGTCLFESADGTFIRAEFLKDGNNIVLENIERLVINEESEREKSLEILETVVKAVFNGDTKTAEQAFDQYVNIDMNRIKRERYAESKESAEVLNEDYKVRLYGTRGKGGSPKLFARQGSKDPEKARAAKLGHTRHPSSYKTGANKRKSKLSQERARRKNYKSSYSTLRAKSGGSQYSGRRKKRMLAEWLKLSQNVFGFMDFQENRSTLTETFLVENADGTTTLTLPNAQKRNEGKVLMMQYDLMKTDLKIFRESARRLTSNSEFCQLIGEARRANALSDDEHLDETLKNVVDKFPGVLYVTAKEMANVVAEALKFAGINSFDDKMCAFLADGIQRTAVEMYSERVDRIIKVSGEEAKSQDKFENYIAAVNQVFPKLDESARLEYKMFEDLFDAANEVRQVAQECQNEAVNRDAKVFMSELEEILSGRQPPQLELATEIAEWLETLAETNLSGEDWNVVKTPYQTENGDNPAMFFKAKQGYSPSADGGADDYSDVAPVSDGKNYKNNGLADEMRNRSWGNKGGNDVWPSLSNPVVPESPDYTMKGEPGVDKNSDSAFGQWGDSSTFPQLNNPYLPAAQVPHQKVDPSNSLE